MLDAITIVDLQVYGYKFSAERYFESAHSMKSNTQQRETNKENFVAIFTGERASGDTVRGAGEGTPRGISGDTADETVRKQFIDEALDLLVGQTVDVSSPAAALTDVKRIVGGLFDLAQKIRGDVSKKPFRGSIAGLEAGLLQLVARAFDMTLSEFLGKRRDKISISTASLSLNASDEARLKGARKTAERFQGWRMKAGDDVKQAIVYTMDYVAVGMPEKFIWYDFNQALSLSQAMEFIQGLVEESKTTPIPNPIILEQPIKKADLGGLIKLQTAANASGLDILIMADEAVSDQGDWAELFKLGPVRAVNIKVQKTGGILGGLALAEQIMADSPDTHIYVGNMLNYSDLTRWQLIEFSKALPRFDYFTSTPSRQPHAVCKTPTVYASGTTFADFPRPERTEDYVDFDFLNEHKSYLKGKSISDPKGKATADAYIPNPGKHVFIPKSKAVFSPASMISGNPKLGEILKYWGRNVFSNALFEETALKRGCNTVRSSGNLFFAETGTKRMSVYAQTPMQTAPKEVLYTKSKSLSKYIFERDGHNTPLGRSFTIRQKDKAVAYAEQIGWPVVLKPNAGHGGHGVVLGLSSAQQVAKQIEALGSKDARYLIERQLKGYDHRFVVLQGKTIAVWRRVPANVVGDGVKTIKQLAAEKNREKSFTFSRLKLDDETIAFLAGQGVTPDTVLAEGQQVFFNNKENLTQGGDAVQMLDGVHPSYYEKAEQIAASIPNYDHYAIDLMIEDCTVPASDDNWAVLEANSRPDILGGQYPDEGEPLPLSDLIFDGYARDRLDLQPARDGVLDVELRFHTRAGGSKLDRVLDEVAAVVPLTITDRQVVSDEYATAQVSGEARYLAFLSTYLFHPEIERGHHMVELVQRARAT